MFTNKPIVKVIAIVLQLLLFLIEANAQFGPQQVISTGALQAKSVYAVDLDGDGDLDVLSASAGDHKIAWYENADGLGNFTSENIISTDDLGAKSVYGADLDGDGDLDVISASHLADKIVWYENIEGNFGPQRIISADTGGPLSIHVADIDGDGDLDVLSGSGSENDFEQSMVLWHENTDGKGNFGTHHTITTDAYVPFSVYAIDLNGDLDLDVLIAAAYNNKLIWHENIDGLGTFGLEKSISDSGFPAWSFSADVDGDGDNDVLASHGHAGTIAWYRNLGNDGNFGPQEVLGNVLASNYVPVYAADLDRDGGLDVLSASASDNKILWYKNMDGLGNFDLEQIVTQEVAGTEAIYAADLDGDGDLDVLSASAEDNKIAWYEKLGFPVSSESFERTPEGFHLGEAYPNPFNQVTSIGFDLPETSDISLKIYNLLGKEVAELATGIHSAGRFQVIWDAQGMPSGIYMYRIQAGPFLEMRHVVLNK